LNENRAIKLAKIRPKTRG